MKKISIAVVGLMAIMAASVASASMSVADLSAQGDGLLTVDSESGLAWLDITPTRGMSMTQAASSTWFEQGFRFATASDLNTLITHGTDFMGMMGAMAAPPEFSAYVGGASTMLTGMLGGDGARDSAVPVVSLMLTPDTHKEIYVGGPDAPPAGFGVWVDTAGQLITGDSIVKYLGSQNGTGSFYQSPYGSSRPYVVTVPSTDPVFIARGSHLRRQDTLRGIDDSSPDVGVFLVKSASAVPEPSTWALMCLGLFGMFSLARSAQTKSA